jgi:hypothetical protein
VRTETAFVEPFRFQNDQFAKTGSGQTREKLRHKAFSAVGQRVRSFTISASTAAADGSHTGGAIVANGTSIGNKWISLLDKAYPGGTKFTLDIAEVRNSTAQHSTAQHWPCFLALSGTLSPDEMSSSCVFNIRVLIISLCAYCIVCCHAFTCRRSAWQR